MSEASHPLLQRITALAEQVGLARDRTVIYRALVDIALRATPAERLLVWDLDADREAWRCVFTGGTSSERYVESDGSGVPDMPLNDGRRGRAVREGKVIVVDDLAQSDAHDVTDVRPEREVEAEPPRSSIILPLIVLGETIGAFELQSASPAAFGDEHVIELRLAANLAAIALKNLHLVDEQRQALEQARTDKRRLEDVLEQAPTLTASFEGPEHVFTSANEPYHRFFPGRDIVIGERLADVLPEVESQGIIGILDRVYATGESFTSRELHLDLDIGGNDEWTRHYFDLVYQPLRGEGGRVVGVIAQAIDITRQVEARRQAETLHAELRKSYDRTIEGWGRALDLKDEGTAGHSQRVTHTTVELARRMGVGEEELVHVRRGALLHDIGKMGVPDRILLKARPLEPDEREIMERHTTYAYEFLSPIEHLRPAIAIPLHHHERWDGSGYPSGLAGRDIPFAARIFAVIDVFDALTSDRPYRRAWSRERALAHIEENAGTHFDPRVVREFLRLVDSEIEAARPAEHRRRNTTGRTY